MKIMMLAAATASFWAASPAFAGEADTDFMLAGGTMKITDPDGESFSGNTVGIGVATRILSAQTDSGIGIDLRAKAGVEAVDLHETRFSYSYEEDSVGTFDVQRGFEIDGRAYASVEIGFSYAGLRLAAATGFQVAHVGELWSVDGPGTAADYRSAFRTYAAGQVNEFTVSYSIGGFSIGAFYQEGDLELSSTEYQDYHGSYGLENENVGGMVSWRSRF